ncbi:MAG: ketoacyl-ACP synthase III [Puniceicoccales bacterium]|jgi:3-oxoacyl-[acyl-carrier-protein] synthase-3|nr:ketoacyl-ACP synthase III [Puniceicoccales bacterium]
MATANRFAKLVGIGSYVPDRIMTNDDISKIVDTSDEWIVERTGIRERHIAADSQATSDLCVVAAQRALENAKLRPEDIDLILTGTVTPDMLFPSTSVLVQSKLGVRDIPCFDYNSACSGTQYGIEIAHSLLTGSDRYENILVVCGDKMSSVIDWQDRSTCVLLGDGAGALVLSATENERENFIIDMLLGSNGMLWNLLTLPAGGSLEPATEETVKARKHFLRMSGRDVFREAVKVMESCSLEILRRNGMSLDDVDFIVPHQANLRIIRALQERLGVGDEKVCVTVDRYGNTSGSSCILAMDSLVKSGKIVRGSKILSVAFGAGLTWGTSLLRF